MGQQGEARDLTLTNRHVVFVASPDVADAVAQAVRLGFGVVSLGLAVALRSLAATPPGRSGRGPRLPVSDAADVVVGTAWWAARLSGRVATAGTRVAAPVVSVVLRPPGVPRTLQLGHGADLMVARWRRDRPETVRSLGDWSAGAFTSSLDGVLGHVDLERALSAVLNAVDLDRVVADVVRRLAIDVLVGLVLERMDVDKVVATALDRVDLTELVLQRVDLERVVTNVLERVDLTSVAVEEIDLGRLVTEALQQVDLTEIVMEQVDLIGVAEYVVAGIDLPEIIRASTGSVASEAVRGLRMQGVDADLAVARIVDRVLFRGSRRRALDEPAADEPRTSGGSGEQT
jgi:hypothetical protein